jgi:hypothetical protein
MQSMFVKTFSQGKGNVYYGLSAIAWSKFYIIFSSKVDGKKGEIAQN